MPLTIQKIKEISKNGGSNIMVHPKLFQVFDVARVPSIVQIKDSFECHQNGSLCDERNVSYDKITGSVSIKYALEQFNDL